MIGAAPKFSGGIPHRCDVLEQVDAHPKTPSKIDFGICRILLKYDRINLLCPLILSLHNFCLPNTDPPIFGFLMARQTNSMEMFSSSILYSLSDESYDKLYKHA
jgi:hypothetical protein